MKFLLLVYRFWFLAISAVSSAKDAARLNVLSTNGVHIGLLYSRLYSTKSHSETDPTTEAVTKKLICHYVSTSQSLPPSRRQSIYLTEIYDHLKGKYSEIFDRLYGDNSAARSKARQTVYTNLTDTISVANSRTAAQLVQETAFVCVERTKMEADDADSGVFAEYFVSEEYDVSDDPEKPNNYIAGRFIFRYNNDRADCSHPVVEALAEEPATAIFVDRKSISNVELEYRKRKYEYNKRKDEESEVSDLCSWLDEKQKARVCNLVFNSAYFDGELSSQEIVSSGDRDCRKQTIAFRTPDNRPQSSADAEEKEVSYAEWMFYCTPRSYHLSPVPLYWISRAYGNEDEVFVYRGRQEHDPSTTVQLENLFKHIRLRTA